ncbi:MAG: FkbM family methyltransferase [Candidatus Paceibacterota bacterium]
MAIFKNWPVYLSFRFNLLDRSKERDYFLRNGLIISAANTEPWGIKGVFVDKEYTSKIKILDNYTVIDIGANIGAFSLFAANSADNVKVYSYEPAPETFSKLIENIKANNLEKEIKAFQLGIASKKEKRKIYLDPESSMANSLSLESNHQKNIEIDTISLRDIFLENNIGECDFLKVDAEGSEQEIFFSTSSEYLHKIKNIAIEYDGEYEKLEKYLKENGFTTKIMPKTKSMGLLFATLNR